MTKPLDGKKIIEDAKESVKEDKQNNKKGNQDMKKPIIITVIITLTTVAALVGMFLLGASYNQGINDRVHKEAKALVAVQPSKQ